MKNSNSTNNTNKINDSVVQDSNKCYMPFARKYRPANFSELLGQEVLVQILTYSIQKQRLAHSYLLTGIRGVGKTSSARIIAQTINCNDPLITQKSIYYDSSVTQTNSQHDSQTDPQNSINTEYLVPCQKCVNCKNAIEQNHPDIIEIDAASRTSVDHIREIINGSEYKPLVGRYKFYIIDEIHMLSKNAFNALLKIIEEPPQHVIFIFATTEVHKIPLTVISRCQRYDLRRLTPNEIQAILIYIVQNEKIACTDEALKILALKSEGSARDAVIMLDQANNYSITESQQKLITASHINKMLGLINHDIILQFINLIIAKDASKAIELLYEVYMKSYNLVYWVQSLIEMIAELSKKAIIPNYHTIIYSNDSNKISEIVEKTNITQLTILWQIFNNGLEELKKSHNELITAEMLIIKAVYVYNLPDIEDILDFEKNDSTDESIANPDPVASENIIDPSLSNDIMQQVQEIDQKDRAELSSKDSIKNKTVSADILLDLPKILEFLKFCYQLKEMEVYYLLLNDVELCKFSSNNMHISYLDNTKHSVQNHNILSSKMINKIKTLLLNWSSNNWVVTMTKQDQNISSLKDKMFLQMQQSTNYELIKNHFPNAEISDIVLRK